MESNQDSVALAQQIQALVAIVEELTRQNQEMKLRLQQEENRRKAIQKMKGIVGEEVTRQDPFLRKIRIQISFKR